MHTYVHTYKSISVRNADLSIVVNTIKYNSPFQMFSALLFKCSQHSFSNVLSTGLALNCGIRFCCNSIQKDGIYIIFVTLIYGVGSNVSFESCLYKIIQSLRMKPFSIFCYALTFIRVFLNVFFNR